MWKTNQLFHANLVRLSRSVVFWICNVSILVYTVVYMLNGCRQRKNGLVTSYFLEDFYFQFAILIGLFAAVFTTLYLSVEYGNGVLRNKIIVGHTRADIYLSNLRLGFFASVIMMGIGLAGGLVGIPTFGTWNMGGLQVLLRILIMVMFLFAFRAVFTMLCMLIQNKSICAIVTVLAYFALLVASSMMINRLMQPEMVSDTILTAQGVTFSEPKPNPLYLEGFWRKVLDFIIDLIPAGQGIRLSSNDIGHPVRMLALSTFVTVFFTAFGLFMFNKKDLK